MKIPRQVLLDWHRHADAKLDGIQYQVLSHVSSSSLERHAFVDLLHLLWREIFMAARTAWLGLASVWLVIAGIQLANETGLKASIKIVSKPDARFMNFPEQRKALNELIAALELKPQEQPKAIIVPKRSERCSENPFA